MNLFGALDVSASALQAQRIRAEVVAVNMANAETTRTADGGPYQREHVVFEAQDGGSFQESLLGQGGLGLAGSGPGGLGQFAPGGRLRNASFLSAMPGSVSASGAVQGGVAVTGIIRDTSEPLRRYEPGHPDADADGYVSYPDINPLTEMVDLMGDAQFRIRGAILDSLRTLDWSPRELRRKGRAVEEAIRSVTQRLGRAPSEPEIAKEMELTLNEFQILLGDLKGLEIGSLHMERTEDSGDQELAYIPGAPDEDPLFRCLKGELKQRLADAIQELPERERLVLTLYYYEELTMKEIGLTLGVVESRVSQIHSAAVLRLRVALAALQPEGDSGKKESLRMKTDTVKRRSAA